MWQAARAACLRLFLFKRKFAVSLKIGKSTEKSALIEKYAQRLKLLVITCYYAIVSSNLLFMYVADKRLPY